MSRKAVLMAVVFLVSTLGLVVTPARAQPLMRIYGWGAVTGYEDYRGVVDASGGVFFSVRGDRWMVWAYFRDPYTNELIYITLDELLDYDIHPTYGLVCIANWDIYVDWTYQDTVFGLFQIEYWRLCWLYIELGDFLIYGLVMFSRVRPYYIIT